MIKIRVAAYCRVSTDKEDQANSLASQRSYFEDYINNHDGWTLKEIYYDDGISGTSTDHRHGFNRMITDALNHEIDLIITKEVSRFARNTVDVLSYARQLKNSGTGICFINDNINTLDKDGELRLSIMATIAQDESRKTSERVKWGQQRRMEQGVVFGRSLLGYTVDKGKIYINEDEAETVKLIFHKFLNEEKGSHTIAKELREAGIRPMRVKEWKNTVVLRVLRNEKYVGDLCQKKTFTPDYLTHKKKYNRGQEEMVYIKDHHEPIIDRETWDRTQAELKRRSPSDEQKSKHSNRYWCSGKIICGECGRTFVNRKKKLQNNAKYMAWRCGESAMHGQPKIDKAGNHIGCTSGSVNDKVLSSSVAYCLKFIQENCDDIKNDMLAEIGRVQNKQEPDNSEQLRRKIEDIKTKKTKAIELNIDGIITKSDLKEQLESFNNRIQTLMKEISKIENANAIRQSRVKSIEDYITEIERIMKFDVDDTVIYHEMLEKIVVYNGSKLVVFLKSIPFGIELTWSASGKGEQYTMEFEFVGTEPKT